MIPRALKRRKRIQKQRKRFMKICAVSIALSSLSLGSAKLITPTYGKFNSVEEENVGITSCFIFPNTILNYQDTATKLLEENLANLNRLSSQESELGFDSMIVRVEKELGNSDNFGTSSSSIPSVETSEKSDIQKEYSKEVAAMDGILSGNTERMMTYENLVTELNRLNEDIMALSIDLTTQLDQSVQSLDEIIQLVDGIEKAKNKAEEECNYEADFFPTILKEMYTIRDKSEEVISTIKLKSEDFEQKREKIKSVILGLNDHISNLESENRSLAESLANKQKQMEEASKQKQELIKKQEEEAARKKEEEDARLKAEQDAAEKATGEVTEGENPENIEVDDGVVDEKNVENVEGKE